MEIYPGCFLGLRFFRVVSWVFCVWAQRDIATKSIENNMERMRSVLTHCKMEEYGDLFEDLGFDDVETFTNKNYET